MTDSPINTVIVDDEPLSRQLIHKLIKNDEQIRLIGQYGDGETAFAAIYEQQPQLVLMDIQMPLMTGIEAVEKLLQLKRLPYVIFITAFDQHAIKAFELGAVDYLVKPLNKARFCQALERAKIAITQQQFFELGQKMLNLSNNLRTSSPQPPTVEKTLNVFKGEQLKRIAMNDIIWVEALNQYLKIHTLEDAYILSENLAQFSKKLNEDQFVRVHRSSIVNLNQLRQVKKKGYGAYILLMANNDEIKLARSRTELLEQLLSAATE